MQLCHAHEQKRTLLQHSWANIKNRRSLNGSSNKTYWQIKTITANDSCHKNTDTLHQQYRQSRKCHTATLHGYSSQCLFNDAVNCYDQIALKVTTEIIIEHWRNSTDGGKPTYSETPPSQYHDGGKPTYSETPPSQCQSAPPPGIHRVDCHGLR